MTEIFKESLTIYTLPATMVLGVCLVYWLLVILGALDLDFLNFGGDASGGAELEAGGDAGQGGGEGGHDGWLSALVRYFNLVDVPVMVFLTLSSLSVWVLQVNLNAWFNAKGAVSIGFGFLALSVLAGLFVTKAVTSPLRPIFHRLDQGGKALDVVGHEAVVKSGQITEGYGQIELAKEGAPLVLNARVGEGGEPLFRGDKVIIFREDPVKGICYVRKI